MADDKKPQDDTLSKTEAKAKSAGTDAEAGVEVGVDEGTVHALRDDAGVNQSPGHTANLASWEQTEDGKAFLKAESDRQKEVKEEEKALTSATSDDNLDPKAEEYLKALKGSPKSGTSAK